MVVMGAISTPDSAPMKAARKKVSLPASVGEMPIKRAPTRLIAVARSALPYSVRSKNWYSPTMSRDETASTHSVCPLIMSGPRSKLASLNAGVRWPSAPKNSRPRPTIVICSATDTISRIKTGAEAMGWYMRRYIIGPKGTTTPSVSSTCSASGNSFTGSRASTATSASG